MWTAVQEGEPIAHAQPTHAAACGRRSSRSRTSGSGSRTARGTRWCSYTASTPRRPCAGAKVSIVRLDNKVVLERHDRRGRRRDRAAHCRCATPRALVREVRLRRRRPRRTATSPTSAATGTKGSSPGTSASDFNLTEQTPAARHGVHRSRRLPARRGGALQGGAAEQHADGIQAATRAPDLRQRPRQPGPRGRRADGQAVGRGAAPSGRSRCRPKARSGTTPCVMRLRPIDEPGRSRRAAGAS